jgi:myo-inositol-1(or 4)-monophosphatase
MKSNTNVRNFSKLLQRALAIRRAGSAALDLAYVACGRFDGFWELDLHPWDTAAGSVIVEEAGGKVTTFCGANYTCHEKEVLATNSRIHKQMSLILLQ